MDFGQHWPFNSAPSPGTRLGPYWLGRRWCTRAAGSNASSDRHRRHCVLIVAGVRRLAGEHAGVRRRSHEPRRPQPQSTAVRRSAFSDESAKHRVLGGHGQRPGCRGRATANSAPLRIVLWWLHALIHRMVFLVCGVGRSSAGWRRVALGQNHSSRVRRRVPGVGLGIIARAVDLTSSGCFYSGTQCDFEGVLTSGGADAPTVAVALRRAARRRTSGGPPCSNECQELVAGC